MSIHLLETIQNNLHYPPLKKIDPNTQELKAGAEHTFSQAAIPAVLIGFYTYSGHDTGAERILRGVTSSNWVSEIFGNKAAEVVQKVASYASCTYDETLSKMNEISNEAVNVVRTEVKPSGSIMDVKNLLSNQVKDILKYLPGALQMGQVVKEESLDDNTNKMEGPMSSLMHTIENKLSGGGS